MAGLAVGDERTGVVDVVLERTSIVLVVLGGSRFPGGTSVSGSSPMGCLAGSFCVDGLGRRRRFVDDASSLTASFKDDFCVNDS